MGKSIKHSDNECQKFVYIFSPTGSHPQTHRPLGIEKIAQQVIEAFDKGVTAAHIHLIKKDGAPETDSRQYQKLTDRIRAVHPQAILSYTASRKGLGDDAFNVEKRAAGLFGGADFVPTVAAELRAVAREGIDAAIENSSPQANEAKFFLEATRAVRNHPTAKVEIEITHPDLIGLVKSAIDKSILPPNPNVNVLFGVTPHMPAKVYSKAEEEINLEKAAANMKPGFHPHSEFVGWYVDRYLGLKPGIDAEQFHNAPSMEEIILKIREEIKPATITVAMRVPDGSTMEENREWILRSLQNGLIDGYRNGVEDSQTAFEGMKVEANNEVQLTLDLLWFENGHFIPYTPTEARELIYDLPRIKETSIWQRFIQSPASEFLSRF